MSDLERALLYLAIRCPCGLQYPGLKIPKYILDNMLRRR